MIETDFINLKVNGENITVSTGDRLLHAIKKTQKSVSLYLWSIWKHNNY